jgi:hypothetical protein
MAYFRPFFRMNRCARSTKFADITKRACWLWGSTPSAKLLFQASAPGAGDAQRRHPVGFAALSTDFASAPVSRPTGRPGLPSHRICPTARPEPRARSEPKLALSPALLQFTVVSVHGRQLPVLDPEVQASPPPKWDSGLVVGGPGLLPFEVQKAT